MKDVVEFKTLYSGGDVNGADSKILEGEAVRRLSRSEVRADNSIPKSGSSQALKIEDVYQDK